MITVRIPALWRAEAGVAQVAVEARDLQAALAALAARCPRLSARLFAADGGHNQSVQLFINREAIRYHGGFGAPLKDGDEIYIVPMLSGG